LKVATSSRKDGLLAMTVCSIEIQLTTALLKYYILNRFKNKGKK